MENINNIIRIDHLCKSFGDVKAVDDLSFRVGEGELFAFLGVNGAGKSTTINIICGQLSKDSGTVSIDGADIDTELDRVKRTLGVVFQGSVLDKELSVSDNLESRAALYGIHGAAFRRRLAELAGLLEFGDLLSRPIGKLSGGQRRRIDIARALLHEPKILILDEPTTYLDVSYQVEVLELIRRLNRELGITIVMVLHDINLAARYSDCLAAIRGGVLFTSGTPEEMVTEKNLRDIFEIEAAVYRDPIHGCPYFIPQRTTFDIK